MTTERLDLTDVRGCERGRRALEIAAAGTHPLLILGEPGSGRTMLANRMRTITDYPAPVKIRVRPAAADAEWADLAVVVRRPISLDLCGPPGESSETVARRVLRARLRSRTRAPYLSPGATELLDRAYDRLRLSRRSFHAVADVATTIAALAESKIVLAEHVAEALSFRVPTA